VSQFREKKEESREVVRSEIPLTARTMTYALSVIKIYREIQNDPVGRVIGKQLLRSGTSIGANVHEAQAAQSRADFITKLSIAHKEARETSYWLSLIAESGVLGRDAIGTVIEETSQINKILSSSLLTAKQNATPTPRARNK